MHGCDNVVLAILKDLEILFFSLRVNSLSFMWNLEILKFSMTSFYILVS